MTQSAVFDRDLNVLDPERSEINGFQSQRLFGGLCHPCPIHLDRRHVHSLFIERHPDYGRNDNRGIAAKPLDDGIAQYHCTIDSPPRL